MNSTWLPIRNLVKREWSVSDHAARSTGSRTIYADSAPVRCALRGRVLARALRFYAWMLQKSSPFIAECISYLQNEGFLRIFYRNMQHRLYKPIYEIVLSNSWDISAHTVGNNPITCSQGCTNYGACDTPNGKIIHIWCLKKMEASPATI